MNTVDVLENNMQKNANSVHELEMRVEMLNNQVQELLAELSVSPEQLTTFVKNKDNFTEENWNTLLKQQQELDEKLKRELSNIRNPLKTKKAFAERRVEQHWLFVR